MGLNVGGGWKYMKVFEMSNEDLVARDWRDGHR